MTMQAKPSHLSANAPHATAVATPAAGPRRARSALWGLGAIACVLALSGCAHHPSRAQMGSGVGAVAGGLLGNAVFGTTLGTVGGAAAGAMIGNEIGSHHHSRGPSHHHHPRGPHRGHRR